MESTGEFSQDVVIIAAVSVVAVVVAGYFMFASSSDNAESSGSATTSKKGKTSEKSTVNKFPAGEMSIYFGSQTGTAEGFSRTVMEDCRKNGFDAKMCDLEDFDPEDMKNTKLAVFLVATYGEGEPTDNATRFIQWAKDTEKELDNTTLSNTSYLVFGLGNTQYDMYNKVGKDVDSYMCKLGATRLMELGLGDDNGTLEEDFENWNRMMLQCVMRKYHPDAEAMGFGADAENKGSDEFKMPSKVTLMYQAVPLGENDCTDPVRNPEHINSSTRHFFTAPEAEILVNRELRTKHGGSHGSTKHLELNLEGTGLAYDTADNLAIVPENNPVMVNAVLKALKYNPSEYVVIKSEDPGFKEIFPSPCTISDIFTRFIDIQGSPRHSLLNHLLPYITDNEQQQWLIHMLSKENKEEYKEFMKNTCSCFASLVVKELSSLSITLSELLHILPPIQPRFYTIASSASAHPETVHLTVATSEQPIVGVEGSKVFVGLCSGYSNVLSPLKDTARIFIRSSSFRLPINIETPITMIGPGTGIAPMRALLQERYYQSIYGPTMVTGANETNATRPLRSRSNSGGTIKRTNKNLVPGHHKVGTNTLYFGCKNSKDDFIYKDELFDYRDEKKILHNLHLAFSRENPKKKVCSRLSFMFTC